MEIVEPRIPLAYLLNPLNTICFKMTLVLEIVYLPRKSKPLNYIGSHVKDLTMNVGKTTAHEAFRNVVNALNAIRNDFIKPAVTVDEKAASIAGAIDGCHKRVRPPRESAVDYIFQQIPGTRCSGTVSSNKCEKGTYLMFPLGFPENGEILSV